MSEVTAWRRISREAASGVIALDRYSAAKPQHVWGWVPFVAGDLDVEAKAYHAMMSSRDLSPDRHWLLLCALLLPPYADDLTARLNLHSIAARLLCGGVPSPVAMLARGLAVGCIADGLNRSAAIGFDAVSTVVGLPSDALAFRSIVDQTRFWDAFHETVRSVEDATLRAELQDFCNARRVLDSIEPWPQSMVPRAHAAIKGEISALADVLDDAVVARLPHAAEAPLVAYSESQVSDASRIGAASIRVWRGGNELVERGFAVVQRSIELLDGLFGATILAEPVAMVVGSVEVVVRLRWGGDPEHGPALAAVAEQLARLFAAQSAPDQFGPMGAIAELVEKDRVELTVELRGTAGEVTEVSLDRKSLLRRVPIMAEQTLVPSIDVPQANELDRVFRVAELVATGRLVDVPGLRMPRDTADIDPRQVSYYRHGARILGLVDSYRVMGLTPAGAQIARMQDADARLVRAAVLFEVSRVGRAWLDWAGATSIGELDSSGATEFVARRTEVTGDTVPRRASTLRAWLAEFKRALRTTG